MKKTKILYWTFTGLLALAMLFSSIPDIIVTQQAVDIVSGHLHYPVYIIPFLGVAKVLAVIAIVTPGFPRLKEWAYAGLVFDLAGATYSAIALGDPLSTWWPMSIFFIIVIGSYTYYHRMKKNTSVSIGTALAA